MKSFKAVNLGCGASSAPGWINLDNSPGARLARYPWLRWALWKTKIISDKHYNVQWPDNLLVRDLTQPLPFEDYSIDFLYASHVLEHLHRADAERLLREIYRVLKVGGLARIVVPDLSFGARRYIDRIECNPDDELAAPQLLDWLQLNKPGHRDPHLWMYDPPSLAAKLASVGFGKVELRKHKEGRVKDTELLDNRPTDSLHMEAEKLESRALAASG